MRRIVVWPGAAGLILLAAVGFFVGSGRLARDSSGREERVLMARSPSTVEKREIVTSGATRNGRGLRFWPDGAIGVLKSGSTYTFFSSNSTRIARTVGTLDNPVVGAVAPSIAIQGLRYPYNYASGGPVYRDPRSGMLLMVYHAEIWYTGAYLPFYAVVGMAKSIDSGSTWTDLGEIVRPSIPLEEARALRVTVGGGGRFLIVGEYVYLYSEDRSGKGSHSYIAVARARLTDVVTAALTRNQVVPWFKYLNGTWIQPGLGGEASSVAAFDHPNSFAVSYNEFLGRYLMIVQDGHRGQMLSTESSNGVDWSPASLLLDESEDVVRYPTIMGVGAEPRNSGRDFYLYYVFAERTPFQWRSSTHLVRRKVLLTGN